MTPDLEVPVLVVGGSLVGMSTAMLLGHYGVRSMVVERHRGTAIHPRAAQISQRTMEILRTVGIEQIVRRSSEEQFVQDGAIMAVETLAGAEISHYISNLNEGIRDVSPCERVFISQSMLEPLLRARAEESGADLRFSTSLQSFEQDAEGVTATIQDRDQANPPLKVRAKYLVACDGAHSRIRQQLGIEMEGRGSFSKSVTIYFRADVRSLLRGRNLSVIYVLNPTLRGFFRFEKPFDSGFLAINAIGDPAHPITDVQTGLTEARGVELVRAALGSDEIPVAVDHIMNWDAEADTANAFRSGRIFLAGDAAHVMPPNGGFGGNTGVQDAQNLAWKLAAVLSGTAGEGLLDTYEDERGPVAAFTVEQAYTRYVLRTAPHLDTGDLQPAAGDLNVELGYGYCSAAVVASESSPDLLHQNPRDSRARPGTRAPHLWLNDVPPGASKQSTLDLFGRKFALLGGPLSDAWGLAARLSDTGIKVHRIDDPSFAAAYDIDPSGCVIVRPDGFVGWKAHDAQGADAQTVRDVMRRLRCTM